MSDQSQKKVLRCAIYTRKSSEEGLEQDFNSLHAQREACEAFIASQRHEGWKAVPTPYDDGGYSGGSTERPGLQQLLSDIQSRRIDVVVVYKVDRLTRSLADFAKIVEVIDAQGVSFVSVTQQFNTTSSMGRLTLNVLLSFAQFEREVTGERIRDKIAASKKKGMWMGGWIPIGYDLKDRSLHINSDEAETVRTIFKLYRKRGNVRSVQAELERLKLTTKRYVATTGRKIGGLPFRRGHIYWILSNPIYIGEIGHKGARHAGQHPAIIDRETWDAVQAQLATNGHKHRTRSVSSSANLLTGLLFDDERNRLTPTHSTRNGKRYRYYARLPLPGRSAQKLDRPILRIAAPEIESTVIRQLKAFLTDQTRVIEHLRVGGIKPARLRSMLERAKNLASNVEMDESRVVLAEIIERIVVGPDAVRLELKRRALLDRLAGDHAAFETDDENVSSLALEIPISFARRGAETKLVVHDRTGPAPRLLDPALLKAVARAHVWFDELVRGRVRSIADIANREGVTDRYVGQTISLALIEPALIEDIMQGRQSPDISVRLLMSAKRPLMWPASTR